MACALRSVTTIATQLQVNLARIVIDDREAYLELLPQDQFLMVNSSTVDEANIAYDKHPLEYLDSLFYFVKVNNILTISM